MDIMSNLISAIIGGIIALIGVSVRDRQSKNELYAKTVSSDRTEWIKEMRKYLVELIVICRTINSDEKNTRKKESNRIKLERCRANILMRLNPNPNKDSETEKELIDALEKIIERVGNGCFNIQCVESVERVRENVKFIEKAGKRLLKDAWERVKAEAGETIKKREDIFCRMEELEQSK
jgi:hypothetical protein